MDWNDTRFFGQPVLVGLESARALLDAADRLGSTRRTCRDIFHDNAHG